MSNWKIIEPIGSFKINHCDNPSIETSKAGWSTGGTNTIDRSTVRAWRGASSLLVTHQDSVILATYAATVVDASTTHTVTAMVYVPSAWDGGNISITISGWGVAETVVKRWTSGTDATDTWHELQSTIPVAADLAGNISIVTNAWPTAGRTINVDAMNLYPAAVLYTYWDGDQPGAYWLGQEHASKSKASAYSRDIGFVADLKDTLNAAVREIDGAGATSPVVSVDSYALLPGGQTNNIKDAERVFTLLAVIKDAQTSPSCNLNAMRQALIKELAHDRYPQDRYGWQKLRIRHTGGAQDKEALCHYEGGLEAVFRLENNEHEVSPIRWLCPDPYWYAVKDSHQLLDTNDTDIFRYLCGRQTQGTRQWEDLGLSNNPSTNGTIYAVHYASDGTVYFGGNFTGLDNVAGRNYIAKYDPVGGTWATVGNASDINGIIYAITERPNGDILVGGAFTNAGGVAAADYIAVWDGSNWTALGAPATGATITDVRAIKVLKNGDILVGGDFTNFAGVANADYVAQWDLSAATWIAPGGVAGANGIVYAVEQAASGDFYAGGAFTQMQGATAYRVAQLVGGTAWHAMGPGSGLNNAVRGLAYDGQRDLLYIAGGFTQNAGSAITLRRTAIWDNQTYREPSGGLNGSAYAVRIAPDNVVFYTGAFTEAGGIATLPDHVARYRGGASGIWSQLDVVTPASNIYAIDFGQRDPVTGNNYNIYLGFDATGSAVKAGKTNVANGGGKPAYPQLTIGRVDSVAGVAASAATVSTLRNETTGRELIFNYDLLDREKLIVEMHPTRKAITSNFFGEVPEALVSGDIAQWYLQAGANEVTALITLAGSAASNTQLVWRNPFGSFD